LKQASSYSRKEATAAAKHAFSINSVTSESYFVQGLGIAQEMGSKFWIAYHKFSLARIEAVRNRGNAIQLARAALALWEELRAPEAESARKLLAQLSLDA
jgi:hypothetical protein